MYARLCVDSGLEVVKDEKIILCRRVILSVYNVWDTTFALHLDYLIDICIFTATFLSNLKRSSGGLSTYHNFLPP